MQAHGTAHFPAELGELGISNASTVWWNLSPPALYEQVARRNEGLIPHLGPLVVRTGQHTGCSPNDTFVVQEPTSTAKIWWGPVNHPFDSEQFEHLYRRILAYLQGKDLFIQDSFAGADPTYRLPIRVITETA